jgi:sulfur relay (sulfurtransferase) complex TusBCD TusD component (DsrE family)
MPIRVSPETPGGRVHVIPFVGPIDHTVAIRVDVSSLQTAMVDKNGFLKAGVFLQRNGTPATSAGTGFGVTIEPMKVADGNATADLNAAVDVDVAVCVICAVNRKIVEDSLGRVLTAGELDAFNGKPVVILY